MALTYTWTPVTNCDTFTFHHYLFCYLKGGDATSAASTPNPGAEYCALAETTRTATTKDQYLHRANMDYGVSIFACQNSSCSTWYSYGGVGAPLFTNFKAGSTTEAERWVLEDIYDATDPYGDTDRVISDTTGTVSASAAMMYSTGDLNKHLGIWWSEGRASSAPVIRHMYAEDEGWQSWNSYTGWSDPVTVAEGIYGGSYEFQEPTHPWVAMSGNGEDLAVRLFFHSTGSVTPQIWSIDSVDEFGEDFGLSCEKQDTGLNDVDCEVGGDTGGADTCAHGDLCDFENDTEGGSPMHVSSVLCADEDSAVCFYLTEAAHGRMMWNFLEHPVIEFTVDDPWMLFSGNMSGDCADYVFQDENLGPADLMQAQWQSGLGFWEMETDEVDTDLFCPVDLVHEDRHDPGIIPLPQGEFKAYFQEDSGSTSDDGGHIWECYLHQDTWQDCTEIELAFDDGTTDGLLPADFGFTLADLYECVANIDTVVYWTGSEFQHAAFLHASTQEPYDSDPGDPQWCFSEGGILFAELRN